MNSKKGLGKGLGALFSVFDDEADDAAVSQPSKEVVEQPQYVNPTQQVGTQYTDNSVLSGVNEVDINLIYANPNQPRKVFEPTAMQELCNSIKSHGIIQPIVVNRDGDKYMIIAGERRWRAGKMAGLVKVPCVIKSYTSKQVKEISIIENLQREDLNAIEAARAIRELMEEYNLTQEVVADRIGKSRPAIANTLRLLTLSPDVIEMVESNKLSAGHARCLVVVPAKDQYKYAQLAYDNRVSVREFEKIIKKVMRPAPEKTVKTTQSLELKDLVSEMQRVFATKVSVLGNDYKGRIYIDYYSRDDLDRIAELLEILKSKTLTLKDLKSINKIERK